MKKQLSVLTLAMLFAGTSFGAVIQCPSTDYVVKKLIAVAKKSPSPMTYSVEHEGMQHQYATEFPNEDAKYIFAAKLIDVDFLFSPEARGYRDGSSMSCSYKVMTTTGQKSIVVFSNKKRGSNLKLIGDYWNVINRTTSGEDTRNYSCDAPDLTTCRVILTK